MALDFSNRADLRDDGCRQHLIIYSGVSCKGIAGVRG